ncbi:hypothetical protein Ssi02_54470 [Sinosporangium siamense]|uniref:Uncharacterized protein n=1 Tax=Sinosporangium siamense TaxID=1367973 RepID=A0A919RN33_9ACTN|nr:hypothetical protein Ssi02_54470 [Sinosporangium siamense]
MGIGPAFKGHVVAPATDMRGHIGAAAEAGQVVPQGRARGSCRVNEPGLNAEW